MQNINTRRLAYKILRQIQEDHRLSDEVMNEFFEDSALDHRDKNFVRKIVYGCLENKILLNAYIKKMVSMPFDKIDKELVTILQMGMYQIQFLDKVPASAAVNESVKIAKKVNFRSSGFINGVLRNFLRKKDTLKLKTDSIEESLAIEYSYDRWLVKYFIENFGQKKTEEILAFNQKPALLNVRVNTLKISREELMKVFREKGMSVKASPLTSDGIKILDLGENGIIDLEAFNKGYYYIQDDASILVGQVLSPKPGEKVLDVCAAPGGKALHLAQLMNDQGEIIARDLSVDKINKIKMNMKRLGIQSIKTEVFNAQKKDSKHLGYFDKILVDAPCSGLGIIRKKPQIKYNRSKDDLLRISKTQYDVLSKSSQLLKTGGELVYSTCSLGHIENIDVINKFLMNHTDFDIIMIDDKSYLEILPGDYETDGFFICKLKKL